MRAIKMAPRPAAVGAYTRVGEIGAVFCTAPVSPGFGRRIHPAGAVQGLRAHPSLPVPDRPATLAGLQAQHGGLAEPAAPRARGRRVWGVSAGLGGSRASNPRRCVWERPDQGISAVTSD